MTLVEVVAGLALLATLLVVLLGVKARVIHQNRLAERRRQAASAADQLLAGWWRNPQTFPRDSSGSTAIDFSWRTRPVVNASAQAVGGQVERLDVFDANGADVSVEVLLPLSSK
jgi:type II secretory pathway pseudopilin PulG